MESLQEIIKQLERCEFTNPIGNPIELNIAFIALKKLVGKTLIPKFSVGETLFIIKNNKPIKVKITCSEIFNVDSNQARIKYQAEDFDNPVTWLDHSNIQESELFRTKEELIRSL